MLAQLAFSLPLPGWNPPRIPWPDHAKYFVPVIVAYAIARGEVRRRRTQDELKAGLREEKAAMSSRPDEDDEESR